jgi:biotin carboxyl carrier protein
MNVDVAVNGRPWKVAVEQADGAASVTVVVKGRPRVVEAAWIDRDTLTLIDRAAVYAVRFHHRADGALDVGIGNRVFEAQVTTVRKGRVQSHESATARDERTAAAAERSVKTPMPGRVVKLLVAVGDRVDAGQPVIVVEAMKMENELRAPAGGTVTDVRAAAGMAVEAGAVLMVIGAATTSDQRPATSDQ